MLETKTTQIDKISIKVDENSRTCCLEKELCIFGHHYQETYENDTRRVNLVTEDQIMKYIV